MAEERLQKILAHAGVASRRKAETLITAGAVTVNGQVITELGSKADLDVDHIKVNGKRLKAPQRLLYYALNKPKNYVTTMDDPQGRPTVYDLVRDAGAWMVPVGRLDMDTTGLLIMTNDTEFAERLTNPDYKVPKTYQAKCADRLSDEQIARLRGGIELSDGPTRPALAQRLRDSGKYTHIQIIIGEGRNRQVRRMVEAIGSKVLKLTRVAIGPVRIGDLPIGKWRPLTEQEVRALGGAGFSRPSHS